MKKNKGKNVVGKVTQRGKIIAGLVEDTGDINPDKQSKKFLKLQDKISSKTLDVYNDIRQLVPVFSEDPVMYPYVNKVKEYITNI